MEGLANITNIITQSSIREELYHRRYELNDIPHNSKDFPTSHDVYRTGLKELYVQVLRFQAISICYYASNTAVRAGLDIVKWDDWATLMGDVEKQNSAFAKISDLWKDKKYEEDCMQLEERHQQHMKSIHCIEDDISALRESVQSAQKVKGRRALLRWLSSTDPSSNYNSARESHAREPITGDWLVKETEDFQRWKDSPKSFLWLHGKGMMTHYLYSQLLTKMCSWQRKVHPEVFVLDCPMKISFQLF